jgi:hypothetical protein
VDSAALIAGDDSRLAKSQCLGEADEQERAIVHVDAPVTAGPDAVVFSPEILVRGCAATLDQHPKRDGGHSLRRGLATSAIVAGASLGAVMRQGRSKSERIALGYVEEATMWEDERRRLGLRGRGGSLSSFF